MAVVPVVPLMSRCPTFPILMSIISCSPILPWSIPTRLRIPITFGFTGATTDVWFTLPFGNLCQLLQPVVNNLNSYSLSSSCTFSTSLIDYSIFIPTLTRTPFVYTETDGTLTGTWTGTSHLLYKKNDQHEFIREWNINLTSGRLRSLEFEFLNIEQEITYTNFEFSVCGNPTTVSKLPASIMTLTTADITTLFPSGYMDDGECITVKEYFYIEDCTPNQVVDDTEYELRSICPDFTGPDKHLQSGEF